MSFPGGSEVKNLLASSGYVGSIPGSGRSPGGGNGNPLQYSFLGNPMDRGAVRLQSMGSDATERLQNRSHPAQDSFLPSFLSTYNWESLYIPQDGLSASPPWRASISIQVSESQSNVKGCWDLADAPRGEREGWFTPPGAWLPTTRGWQCERLRFSSTVVQINVLAIILNKFIYTYALIIFKRELYRNF